MDHDEGPLQREELYDQLISAITYGNRVIVITGPISSGKTFTLKHFQNVYKDVFNFAHIMCETGDTPHEIYTQIYSQLSEQDAPSKKVRSFHQFASVFAKAPKSIVILDSFDLLDSYASSMFSTINASIDCNILPQFHYIFVTHTVPTTFISEPYRLFHILFPPYYRFDVMEIIKANHPFHENKDFDILLKRIMDIAEPLSTDIRDLMFLSYQLIKDNVAIDEENAHNFKKFDAKVIKVLGTMKMQQTCRIFDLSSMADAILLSSYITSRTTIVADYVRFAPSLAKKKKKRPNLFETNEYVSIERVIAVAKAIAHSHIDDFVFDSSIYTQIKRLIDLELVEMRGDFFGDPKLKCLATEQEIVSIAESHEISLAEYISQK